MMGGDLMSYVRKAYEKDLLRRYGYVPNNNIELLVREYTSRLSKYSNPEEEEE